MQWTVGGAVALLFLASVVVHELAHALVGRQRGVPATSVVLGFIGGLAPLSIRAARPRDELAIAVAGPLLSVGAGLAITGASALLLTLAPDGGVLADAMVVVGVLNLALAAISLVPALPIDGGRVVRALAWARTGDPDRASLIAARSGRIVGWTAAGAGLAVALAGYGLEGVVAIALGWLLNTGARTVESRVAMERLLRGMHVEDAMDREVGSVGSHLTLDTFATGSRDPTGSPRCPSSMATGSSGSSAGDGSGECAGGSYGDDACPRRDGRPAEGAGARDPSDRPVGRGGAGDERRARRGGGGRRAGGWRVW